ncbi:MAG: T9SS type A sorting domain-containing protein [Flavobacteriales bacterium]|nr:T9SS type A sorting domain-containing protein [Flavobacteriales bacterium]
MKRSLPLFVLGLSSSLVAQPTITSLNMPLVGDVVSVALCSDAVDANALNASAGAMQTWDFSGLSVNANEQFNFVDPAGTLWANDYPGSDLCGISWDGSHSYYASSASALDTEGNAFIIPGTPPEDTAKVILSADMERMLELPYTYGASHSDAFSGLFSVLGFNATVDGTIDLEADGYGTLVLATGTYANVVRYHFNRVQNNTILGQTTTSTKEQWGWVSADHRFWLLLMEINSTTGVTDEVVWFNTDPTLAGPSNVADAAAAPIGIYPNPAEVGSAITLVGAQRAPGAQAVLFDASGRVARTFRPGIMQLPTDGLQAGAYVLRLTAANGEPAGNARVTLR